MRNDVTAAPLRRFIARLIRAGACFKKRRYGYIDRTQTILSEGRGALTLILASDLYRTAVAQIPVADAADAVRYAGSYFDHIDDTTRLGAFATDDGRYLLTAVTPGDLLASLAAGGVPPASVERLVTAQEAFSAADLPIALPDGSALALVGGTVVRLPASYLSVAPAQTVGEALTHIAPCPTGFAPDFATGEAVAPKTLLLTVVLSVLITASLLIQGFLSRHDARTLSQARPSDSALPSTRMELDALSAAWEKKEAEQLRLRTMVAAFASLPLDADTASSAPSPAAAPAQGIVLIPGSRPGDPNRLLVGGDANATAAPLTDPGEYAASLAYENGIITFAIQTKDESRAQELRDRCAKILKTDTVTVKGTSVEGTVQ